MKLKSFIISSFGTDTYSIEHVLHQLNVSIIPNNLSKNVTSISEQIGKNLEKADFVIALIDNTHNLNTFFELGYAKALDLPLMVIAPKTVEQIPTTIQDMTLVRCNIDDHDALFYNVSQLVNFLKNKKLGTQVTRKQKSLSISENIGRFDFQELALKKQVRPKIPQESTLPKELQNANITHRELESVVLDSIKKSGIEIFVEPKIEDRIADFAVWDNKIGALTKNPVLIEVKKNLNSHNVNDFTSRISSLSKNKQYWTLLLYLVGPKNIEKEVTNPYIFPVRLDRFFSLLTKKKFSDIIIELRNKKFHGDFNG